MKMIREIFHGDSESGFTLVELLVSLVITAILAVGVTRILSTSMKTIDYTQTSTLVASNNALIESIVSEDIAASNAFIIPNSNLWMLIAAINFCPCCILWSLICLVKQYVLVAV